MNNVLGSLVKWNIGVEDVKDVNPDDNYLKSKLFI
jgi:hypothetical protein